MIIIIKRQTAKFKEIGNKLWKNAYLTKNSGVNNNKGDFCAT